MCKRLDGRGTKRNSWGGCKLLHGGANEKGWNGVRIVGLLSKELKEDTRTGNPNRIMGRWKGYFDKLLNGENHRFIFEDGVPIMV